MEGAIRAYFNGEGFIEVTTASLVEHPNLDPNIRPVPVNIADPSGKPYHRWLHTSPELSMKKLLARGSGNIYQIGPVFRDGEHGHLHRCEFSMLEWYRVDADYEDAIRDTIRIVRSACLAVTGSEVLTLHGSTFDLEDRWEEMTMAEAFESYAGVDSLTRESLAAAMEDLGYRVDPESGVEELFYHLYVEAVEPHLGIERPTILKDYPSFLGTMAKTREDDPRLLERFEIYIAGLELANGYTESSDAVELAERMERVVADFESDGLPGLSIDEEFLEAMAHLPPCAGVSVGMDRLAMLALDLDDISHVVFPFEPY